jgi:hypothetical protein
MKTFEEIMLKEIKNHPTLENRHRMRFIISNNIGGEILKKSAKIYAQQFIDTANDVILPAIEILPNTYDEDLENWSKISKINN